MNLFINAVSSQGKIILFDDNKTIIDQQEMSILLRESSKIGEIVDTFLTKNHIQYTDLKNIGVVHGPGSFTGIRSVVLYVNTLSFAFENISITPISFFELFEDYPICKTSSKRDIFVKISKSAIIEVRKNEDFKGFPQVYGDIDIPGIICHFTIDYQKILKNISMQDKKIIEPLYIKKPNIT